MSFREELVEQAVNTVWQSHMDEKLRTITPQEFYNQIDELCLNTQEAEDAWLDFKDRQDRVFG